MNDLCRQMQDKIADYVIGALSDQEKEAVDQHIAQCPQCRQYMEGLTRQGESLSRWAEQVQGRVASQEDKVIAALEYVTPQQPRSLFKVITHSNVTKLAAAAMFMLTVGFLGGRLSTPQVDLVGLRTSLEASLKSAIEKERANMDLRLRSAIAEDGRLIRGDIGGEVQLLIAESAKQTLAASVALTNQRLGQLVQLIEAARLQDRQRVATALEQIEMNRLQDIARFGIGLQALAAKTSESPDTERKQSN
jgi:hypothetical protein